MRRFAIGLVLLFALFTVINALTASTPDQSNSVEQAIIETR